MNHHRPYSGSLRPWPFYPSPLLIEPLKKLPRNFKMVFCVWYLYIYIDFQIPYNHSYKRSPYMRQYLKKYHYSTWNWYSRFPFKTIYHIPKHLHSGYLLDMIMQKSMGNMSGLEPYIFFSCLPREGYSKLRLYDEKSLTQGIKRFKKQKRDQEEFFPPFKSLC